MTTSTDISRRFWNLPQKAGEETMREQTFIDDIIQKAHIERLLLETLSGIHTVFDGGAGYGRFSILLANGRAPLLWNLPLQFTSITYIHFNKYIHFYIDILFTMPYNTFSPNEGNLFKCPKDACERSVF